MSSKDVLECLKIRRKIFWSFWDLVWIVEILEIYLATPGSPEVFSNTQKNIWKSLYGLYKFLKSFPQLHEMFEFLKILRKIFWSFGDYELLVEILEKYLATSGSPGVFVNTSKIILKLWRFIKACRNSRKIFNNFRKSWSVCEYFKKYFEAWRTFYGL